MSPHPLLVFSIQKFVFNGVYSRSYLPKIGDLIHITSLINLITNQ